MPELRKDPIVDRWVIISPERANRPLGHADLAKAGCPFCAGNEAMTPPEVLVIVDDKAQASSPGWSVRVVPNKYPAVVPEENATIVVDENYQRCGAFGAHEVIVESPEHILKMALLSEREFEKILHAYAQRIIDLRADGRFRHVLIFKNQGIEAGATFEHIHSQIVALPMIPKQVLEEIESARLYYEANGRCIFCYLIQTELHGYERVIAENARYVAICPFASRVPYETWILPKNHVSCFEQNSRSEDSALAAILRETLVRIDRKLDNPPFNYVIHSNPLDQEGNDYYHWHIEILPKLIQVAGFEWGSGFYINTVTPEQSTISLRQALP